MQTSRACRLGLWLDLGRLGYLPTYRLQQELVALRQQGDIPDTFLAVEHSPCVTLGRAGRPEHILADEASLAELGIEVHRSDRGGDVTYHGPGQLICYAILDLAERDRDVHAHARRLEEVMVRTAAAFGVRARRNAGYPGVWTARGKLGALGIAVRRWVTMHGVALNVSPDMDHFSYLVPCGLPAARVTSLEQLLRASPDMELVRSVLRESCEEVFGCALLETTRDDLLGSSTIRS